MPLGTCNSYAAVPLAAAITDGQTYVTRGSSATGWPGDSDGPPSCDFPITVSDGTNWEIMWVTGGQGTTSLTVTRAAELIGGVQTAFAFGTNASMVPTATEAYLAGLGAANAVVGQPDDTTVQVGGLSGSPDRYPASPNSHNDEFDASWSGSGGGNGWTVIGSPSSIDSDQTTLSHLTIVSSGPSSLNMEGVWGGAPSSFPFTVTAKITDTYVYASNTEGAEFEAVMLGVCDSSGANIAGINTAFHVGDGILYQVNTYNSPTSFNTQYVANDLNYPYNAPLYLRIVCNSASDLDFYLSRAGLVWIPLWTGLDPSFTPAGVMLLIDIETGNTGRTVAFDWVRFTT